jgi:hypothetical protein
MHSARFLGGILAILALAWPAGAQPSAPYAFEDMVINRDGVEVRCGPSPQYYATSKLARGAIVKVVKAYPNNQPGWLAIHPPKGSFSWIDARYVSQLDKDSGVVNAEDIPVLAGSSLTKAPPTVRPVRLRRGTLVTILGPPLVASDRSQWLPIDPNPTEVRYIPADAVQSASPQQMVAAKPPAGSAPAPVNLTSQPGTSVPGQGPSSGLAPSQPPSVGLSGTGISPAANPSTPLYPPPTANAGAPGGGYGPAPAPSAETWIGPGYLRPAAFPIDGNKVYAFCDRNGNLICYVLASPGVPLDGSLTKWVHLYGRRSYRTDGAVRYEFMTVSQVRPLP